MSMVTHTVGINLYFKMSKCNATNSWSLAKSNVTLSSDCPSGPGVKNNYVRRGTTANCTCRPTDPSFSLPSVRWFDYSDQPVSQSGLYSDLVINNTEETNSTYFCYETIYQTKENGLIFQPKFFDMPSVVNFTVNGSHSLYVKVGDDVTVYCKVQADPPARAVLLGSGLGRIKENISESQIIELPLHNLQCEDSGRYFCTGRNGFEDNMTSYPDYVDINMTCPIKNIKKDQTVPTIKISPDENTVFTFEVYGYPEPTEFILKIETGISQSVVDSKKYSVSYLYIRPPIGQINVTVYDADKKGTITYVLNVKNEAGEVSFKFKAIKLTAEEISGIHVQPIILGVVIGSCSLLVLVVVLTIIIVKCKENPTVSVNANVQMSNVLEPQKNPKQNSRPTYKDASVGTRDGVNVSYSAPYSSGNNVNDQDYIQPITDFTYQLQKPQIELQTIQEPSDDYPNDNYVTLI